MNRDRSRQFKYDISEGMDSTQHNNGQLGGSFKQVHSHDDLIPLDRISLDALLQTLIARKFVTHQELSDCESRLRGAIHARSGEPIQTELPRNEHPSQFHKERIVRTHSNRQQENVRFKFLRKLFGHFRWSRRIATALFGWKWRRKGGHDGMTNMENMH